MGGVEYEEDKCILFGLCAMSVKRIQNVDTLFELSALISVQEGIGEHLTNQLLQLLPCEACKNVQESKQTMVRNHVVYSGYQ